MANEITVIFSTPRWRANPFASLIRWLTRSRVSHASIGLVLADVPVVVQATIGGVKVTTRTKFEKQSKIVAEFRVLQDVQGGVQHAVHLIGEHYDYIGLLGYAVVLLTWRWFKKRLKNPLASPTALVCSEFVLRVNQDGKITEWVGLDPEATTAQDILLRCRTGTSFKVVE